VHAVQEAGRFEGHFAAEHVVQSDQGAQHSKNNDDAVQEPFPDGYSVSVAKISVMFNLTL